ncbi:MAG: hypothetical protein BWZ07_01821 [Alphaproteobacteria bacterium ADurb.BinA280]|jgi:hypothetical protein|nr:hypothetical protein [Xanthomonadales bacterium]OPZ11727.1 MAG: hypothetical protein BWZ07_01821 [Alphaproteobacteria bacterium ADurb.BinA280]
MSILIFSLKAVPEDEADDIRALLQSHSIAFFETQASNWGISHGALWVDSESDADIARQWIDEYQQARAARARSERLQTPWWEPWQAAPGRMLMVLLGIFLVLVLTALPALLLD